MFVHLTSKFSSRPLRLCIVLPSWSIVSLGSRGRSPMVFLPYSFRLEPWPRDLPCDDSSDAASQRASLELSSFMVPCWLTMVSFCCRMVSRSWMMVFRSSSSTGLLLWTRFPVGPYPQPGSAPGGIALQTKRLPVASWLRTVRPLTRHKSPTTKTSIPPIYTNSTSYGKTGGSWLLAERLSYPAKNQSDLFHQQLKWLWTFFRISKVTKKTKLCLPWKKNPECAEKKSHTSSNHIWSFLFKKTN